MTENVRRAAVYALVATLSIAMPVVGWTVAVPFLLVALAAFGTTDGPLFDLFARAGDYRAGRLYGLLSFALAATALALLASVFGMPVSVFVGTVLLVGYGNLTERIVADYRPTDLATTAGFTVGGTVAAVVGTLFALSLDPVAIVSAPTVAFLAVAGALEAGLLRSVFVRREDPLVLFTVALSLWLFATLGVSVTWVGLALALCVTVGFGYLSFALGTASIPGMLTGVLLGLLTVVLGGYRWFAVLIAFFAIGGVASKFRYDEKRQRGVAEARGGARGSGNVLGNSTPALLAVVLFAASTGFDLPVSTDVFLFAFAGSIATALSDTLSSEIGSLYDETRLITTFEPVPPGTDGGVTWQGGVAGLAGAALVAALVVGLFGVGWVGALAVVAAGVAGMLADSLLGALFEGGLVGNQTVNFLATTVGAVVGGLFASGLV